MAHTHTLYTLLLSAFITGCVCGGSDLTVWQSPAVINTTKGQHVNISCNFTVTSTAISLKVALVRNNKTVQFDYYNISALRSQNLNSSTVSHTAVLQLPSVRLNHSGTYYCKVWQDVPRLIKSVYGSGTELRVESLPPVNTPKDPITVIVIGALAFGSVLITACISAVLCILYKRCRKRPKVEGEGQPVQVEDEAVLYAALNILKPELRKNTQETLPEPEQRPPDGQTDSEVLYSSVCLKPQNQKHTAALSDQT
ncbi:transmembrane and immunoglobulin domain-containing protein 2 [Salminus brasiliensis]|uniref:transmembrane and immunoglobulin domain-containing protein 2 n=1 Tax=Salminus brasiliensis TaxID=930266 RepID=UPI003B832267